MFKKKKKEAKVISEDASTFTKLWNNEQSHAGIILLGWSVFIAFILIYINIGNKNVTNEVSSSISENIVFSDYKNMQEKLKLNNYSFIYEITINNEHMYFKGSKISNSEKGYKETNAGITKYEIVDNVVYKELLDTKEIDPTIFENVNLNYLNPSFLFNDLNEIEPTINNNSREYIYNISNETDSYKMRVVTDQTSITKIVIESNGNMYVLKYSEIGNIKELQ